MMSNKALLTIITVILLGIAAMVFMNMNERTPGEKIADSISEASEEIGDEIDDATTDGR